MDEYEMLAVHCSEDGRVETVLRDDIGLGLRPGIPVAEAFSPESQPALQRLWAELRTRAAVSAAHLTLRNGPQAQGLYLSAVGQDPGALLLGQRHTAAPDAERQLAELLGSFSSLNNDLVNAQRELARKNAQLERLNREKNLYMGILAHDLRNPLNVVLGMSELLRDSTPAEVEADLPTFAGAISDSAQYMAQLVNDVLDLSVIEAGRLELRVQPVKVASLLEQTVTLCTPDAQRKQVTIRKEQPPLPLEITADRHKLLQVLTNLVSNAIKFSATQSTVILRAGGNGQGGLTLEVEDTGHGMSDEEQARLFQPFQRSGRTGTVGEKTSGLGLAISQRIVHAHGGRITVRSAVEQGTTITVHLPSQVPKG